MADLERALDFYCGVLGFEPQARWGGDAAFISAGDYHHHIGLNTWQSRGGSPPPPGTTGLLPAGPDESGVELYWDRPPEQWPRPADGSPGVEMYTHPLDLAGLLAELD